MDLDNRSTWAGWVNADNAQPQNGPYDCQREGQGVLANHEGLLAMGVRRPIRCVAKSAAPDISHVNDGIDSGDPQLVRPGVDHKVDIVRPNGLDRELSLHQNRGDMRYEE